MSTRAVEELHGACRYVRAKIDDVELDQHFVQRVNVPLLRPWRAIYNGDLNGNKGA